MKELKKLISFNLAIVFAVLCTFGGVSEMTVQAQSSPILMIDGMKYDATQNHEGNGWTYYYGNARAAYLFLQNYNGGPITSTIGISVNYLGENYINGDSGSAILVMGDLYLNGNYNNGVNGRLTVTGGVGYAAVQASGTLFVKGRLNATGGNASALLGGSIDITPYWPNVITVGTSSTDAVEGQYTGQQYVDVSYISYQLTLDGNGGKTSADETSHQVVISTGTAGSLSLYQFNTLFKKDGFAQLGWSENADGTGKIYAKGDFYLFAPDTYTGIVYAVWEDTTQKKVTLFNYCDSSFSTPWNKEVICDTGSTYTLPLAYKRGYTFRGWLAKDNPTILPAGTEVVITENVAYQAQYSPLTIVVDGTEYDASVPQGSSEMGWSYDPIYADLYLNRNYSGGSVSLPSNASISLHTSLTGSNGEPAIKVNGHVHVYISGGINEEPPETIDLIGGSGSPAISATGNIEINVFDPIKVNIAGGSDQIAALSTGESVMISEYVFYAGADEQNLNPVGTYSGEHYISLEGDKGYSIELSGTSTVPSVPYNNNYTFVGWERYKDNAYTWYQPGDTIEAGASTTLYASYLNNDSNSVAISIDGNGGKTMNGSNYFIDFLSSSSNLELYTLPTDCFTYAGHTLSGFNTVADGSGTPYTTDSKLPDYHMSHVYRLFAQWEPNSVVLGDANGDGTVTAYDSVLILQMITGLLAPNEAQTVSCNVNRDASGITAYAAVLLLQAVAGMDTGFPIGQEIAGD